MATNLVNELNSLDFSTLIGGPMQAAVSAQNAASLAQIKFIQDVGFNEVDGKKELIEVEFNFTEKNGETESNHTLKVPLLTMLNIPSLRIEEMTIDFNAKLTSVETTSVESTFKGDASASIALGKFANLKASASYQRKSTSGTQVDKTYSMVIHVKVVNDDIPTGLDRMLSLIESKATLS